MVSLRWNVDTKVSFTNWRRVISKQKVQYRQVQCGWDR